MNNKTNVGLDQFNIPAPLWYRKLTNAIVLCFLPMMTGIIQGVSMTDHTRNYWMIGIAAVPFLLKGIGMILGNGQRYVPSNEQVEAEENKTPS